MNDATERIEEARPRRFRRYPAYKDSGIKWLGEIPAHWEVKPIKSALIRNDTGVWGKDFDDDGTIVLRSTEQTMQGKWRIEEPARRQLSAREATYAKLCVGDLLVTKSSGSAHHIGKTSVVDEPIAALNCCYSNFMQRLRVSAKHVPQFFWYVMNCPVAREQLVFLSSTTTGLGNLNGSILGAIRMPMAPLAEQRTIAAFLDRETAKIDGLVERKERLIELLQEKRTALITRAVTRGLDPNVRMKDSGVEWLGEIPAHWHIAPVYARYEVALGKMLDAKGVTGKSSGKYLRNVDVQWDSVNVEDLPEMDFPPSVRNRYLLRPEDLLVCEGGEVGRTAIWGGELDECFYQKAIHRVRPWFDSEIPRFFYFLMYGLAKRGVFTAGGNPNTINHLTAVQLRHYRLPFPATGEQRAIAAFLDRETTSIDALIAKIRQAIDHLKEFRTAFISAAVTGKIDVREEAS